MATTVARNKRQVDDMTSAQRIWDSLNYSYGKKREDSDKQFQRAYSQADRQMLSRGMQRSSYGAQTLANLDQERIKASGDIWDQQIADYENRMQQAEQQELENERWERQFAANREDTEWNRNFQQQQYDASRSDTAWNQAFQQRQADLAQSNADRAFQYQQSRDATADRQWQAQFDASRSDTAWNQAFQQSQADREQSNTDRAFSYQQSRDANSDSQWQQTFNYQQSRDQTSDQQWEKQFNQTSKQADQQLAQQYALAIIQNGGTPSSSLLKRAGLSKEDAEKMKKKTETGGGGGGGTGGTGGTGKNSKSTKQNQKPNTTVKTPLPVFQGITKALGEQLQQKKQQQQQAASQAAVKNSAIVNPNLEEELKKLGLKK